MRQTCLVLSIPLILSLGGCVGAPVALQVLSGVASAASIADHVFNIDISIQQNQPGKLKLSHP